MATLTAKDVEHVFESLRKGLVPERGKIIKCIDERVSYLLFCF